MVHFKLYCIFYAVELLKLVLNYVWFTPVKSKFGTKLSEQVPLLE